VVARSAIALSVRIDSRDKGMPLLRIDLVKGRSAEDVRALLDTIHDALVVAFKIPERDRYQIVQEHPLPNLIVEDTGLGIERSPNRVVIQITSRPRMREDKQAFYKLVCERLKEACGMAPSDVVVLIDTNADEDWSFGNGRAQFLTGEL
jgi:phenylpyruvate tautomerase PptA (4-oxalocrotonate tautomerase family)